MDSELSKVQAMLQRKRELVIKFLDSLDQLVRETKVTSHQVSEVEKKQSSLRGVLKMYEATNDLIL